MNETTPIWQLTVRELKDLIKETTSAQQVPAKNEEAATPEFVYGINGLAELLGCSRTTAQNIKSSGKIDKAITQIGRQIIINKQQVINILKN